MTSSPPPATPTIPGLGSASDASCLRLMRRTLMECSAFLETRVVGPPRPASDGMFFGGSAPRRAAAALAECGLVPVSAVADLAAFIVSARVSFPTAVIMASERAETMMSGKVSALCGSCGPVESALIPRLIGKAAAVIAEAAAADAAASMAGTFLAEAFGPPRRAGSASSSATVDVMVGRWRRAAENADLDGSAAAYLAEAAAARRAAALVRLRARRSKAVRRRKGIKPRSAAS